MIDFESNKLNQRTVQSSFSENSRRRGRSNASFQNSGNVFPQLQALLQLIQKLIQQLKQTSPNQCACSDNGTNTDGDSTPAQPSSLTLSNEQKQVINQDFNTNVGLFNISIADQNNDGKVSGGDILSGTGFEGGGDYERTLSDNEAAQINGELGNKLDLDSQTLLKAGETIGLDSNIEAVQFIFDKDGDGEISTGDIITTRSAGAQPAIGDLPPEFPIQYHTVTSEEAVEI